MTPEEMKALQTVVTVPIAVDQEAYDAATGSLDRAIFTEEDSAIFVVRDDGVVGLVVLTREDRMPTEAEIEAHVAEIGQYLRAGLYPVYTSVEGIPVRVGAICTTVD